MTEPMPQPKNQDPECFVEPPETPRLSRKQTASFLGCTTRTVDRLHKEGRLASLNGHGKVPVFAREEVVELARERKALRMPAPVSVDASEPEKAAAAATNLADVGVALVSGATGHAEEMAKLALGAVQRTIDSAHANNELERKAFDRERLRMQTRIDKLEEREDAVIAALDAHREQLYNVEIAKAEVAKRARMYDVGKDFLQMLAPGLATRFNPNSPNAAKLQKTGLQRIFAHMTPERRADVQATLMSKLDEEEQMALFLLFSDEATAEERAEHEAPKTEEAAQ